MENPPNDRIKPSKWKQGRLPALYNQTDKIVFFSVKNCAELFVHKI